MADNHVDGVIALGEELHLTNDSGTLTKVLGLKSIKEPSFILDEVDDTDMDSGGVKDYLASLGDRTMFEAVIKHRPGSETHLLIEEHLLSRERRPFKILLRAGNDGSTVEAMGEIILMAYDKPSRTIGATSDATLRGRVRAYTEGAITAPGA